MAREDILQEAQEAFGSIPEWFSDMPDAVMEQYWNTLTWLMQDTDLAARDKVLVAFGAATAIHCRY